MPISKLLQRCGKSIRCRATRLKLKQGSNEGNEAEHVKSPAARLPVELLCNIFEKAVEDDIYVGWTLSYRVSTHERPFSDIGAKACRRRAALTMRNVSQVCGLWRGAALGWKAVWGELLDIDKDTYEWTQELLSRSDSSPLVVHSIYDSTSSHGRFFSGQWTRVLDQTHRIRLLIVVYDPLDNINPLKSSLAKPAPALEGLVLERAASPSTSWEGPILLPKDAPKLRWVALQRSQFIPAGFASFTLSSLTITIAEDNEHSAPLLASSLLDILASQPSLTRFRVFSHSSVGANTRIRKPEKISMPHLHLLSFHGSVRLGGDLLGSLALPMYCNAHLHLHPEPFLSDVDGLLEGLACFLGQWRPCITNYQTFKLQSNSGNEFRIRIGLGGDSVHDKHSVYAHKLTLCLTHAQNFFAVASVVIPILDCLSKLEVVKTCIYPRLSLALHGPLTAPGVPLRQALVAFFSSFQHMDSITIFGCYASVCYLTEVLFKHTFEDGTILFPTLRKATFHVCTRPEDKKEFLTRYFYWRLGLGRPLATGDLYFTESDSHMIPALCLDDDCYALQGWRSFA